MLCLKIQAKGGPQRSSAWGSLTDLAVTSCWGQRQSAGRAAVGWARGRSPWWPSVAAGLFSRVVHGSCTHEARQAQAYQEGSEAFLSFEMCWLTADRGRGKKGNVSAQLGFGSRGYSMWFWDLKGKRDVCAEKRRQVWGPLSDRIFKTLLS